MSTQNKYLASDICQIISDLRGESSADTSAVRIRAIDRALGDFSTRRNWRLYKLLNQSLTGDGTSDYTVSSTTFPMRPKGLIELFVGGTTEDCRYEIVDENVYRARYNANNSDKICYQWYDAANDAWKIHINPAPGTGVAITYSYFWCHPAVTASSDAVYIYDPDICARRALAYLYEGEDEDKYQIQYQLSEQAAQQWDDLEDIPHLNQQYSITPQVSRGLGTY